MIQKRNAPGRWHGVRAQFRAIKRPNFTPAIPSWEYASGLFPTAWVNGRYVYAHAPKSRGVAP